MHSYPFLKANSFVNRQVITRTTVPLRSISVVLLFLCGASGIRAAEFSSVVVGYQRQAQVGTWMPVHVVSSGLTPGQVVSLVITAQDARGNNVNETCQSSAADSSGQVVLDGLTRTGRLDSPVRVQLIDQATSASLCSTTIRCSEDELQGNVAEVQKSLRLYRHDVMFLLTIGTPAGIEGLLTQAANASPDSPAIVGVSVDSVAHLPEDVGSYDLFSAIILNGNVTMNAAQFKAVKTWTQTGGHLIVSCAKGIDELLKTPLGQYLDSLFSLSAETRIVTDADLGALQQILPQGTRISTERRSVMMAQLQSDQPVVMAESGNGPLVVRIGSGGGKVTFVSVDLNATPLSRWNSLSDCYAVLMLGAPLSKSESRGRSSRISSSGISDLSTQLMTTIDPQPQSGRWTTWSVMALAFGWLLLIGPVDYLIVVVLLKRPHFTWVTFPLWVILGFVGLYSLKPGDSEAVLNSVHVVDVTENGSGHSVHALSLLSMSAPTTTRAELKVLPDAVLGAGAKDVSLSWSGRSEDVYGGMYRATGIGGGSQVYARNTDQPDVLTLVPLLIDGSFETQASWHAQFKEPLLESDLNVSGYGLLGGSFTHHLSVPVHDWVVIFGNRIYRARDDARESLVAGQKWTFQPGGSQISDLKSYLTGRRPARETPVQVGPGQSSIQVAYSAGGRDPLDIVTMMSLSETAGADSFTGLSNHTLRRLDVSDSIRLNQALVIGWIESPATLLEVDGAAVSEQSSTTIVRFMLPVDRRPARPAAKMEENDDRGPQATLKQKDVP
jgi:hypothetical protein